MVNLSWFANYPFRYYTKWYYTQRYKIMRLDTILFLFIAFPVVADSVKLPVDRQQKT
jgi:hypothetical protein